MGRAFSFLTLVLSFSMPVGLLIASPIAEKVGVNIWFVIAGIGMIAITLAGLLFHHRITKTERSGGAEREN